MAKKTRQAKTAQTDVDSIRHKDKRANIPTEELRDFVADEGKSPKTMLYPRDSSLDPQLVWKGKDEQDAQDLAVSVVPVYIQEKIHPQALIEDLRAQSAKDAPDPQANIYADFNGIEFEEYIDFYHHGQNWTNRMILGDSLLVMASLAEKEGLKGKVQMIFIDPPYGIRFGSNWQVSTRKRDVKDGRAEDATRQPEQIRAFRDTWERGIHSYLAYLCDRLVVARELLTESGSVFVQIGDENVHRVRALIDEVFQRQNHIATITVQKAGSGATKFLGTICDYVVWYAKDIERAKYRPLYVARGVTDDDRGRFTGLQLPDGTRTTVSSLGSLPEAAQIFAPDPLQSASMGREKGEGAASWFPINFRGSTYLPNERRRWST